MAMRISYAGQPSPTLVNDTTKDLPDLLDVDYCSTKDNYASSISVLISQETGKTQYFISLKRPSR
ncbi:unnamed protein product [Ilex paraguariensis]|uniref:Uncharacterized protein n=1 Tax=Ilex paraguariensis TaxID=185542 RepID=A0ABC8SA77_9AQUA